MKAAFSFTILFFLSLFSIASESMDMDTYVANTAAEVSKNIQENNRLVEIGAGSTGTYFVDQRLALDGIVTVDTTTARLYNRSLYQNYNGEVIVLLHIIYPEGQGGKQDVIDSTLLFSQRISALSDPQHNKIIIHVWGVINRIADKLYTFTHVIAGTNSNNELINQVNASVQQANSCGVLTCSLDELSGIGEVSEINFVFKFNLLDPAGRVFTTDNGDIEVLSAIEKGPILAFKFNSNSTIYEAKFSGEKFIGYASKNGSIKYTQSFIDNGADYSIQLPVIGTDNTNGIIVKWYSLSVTKNADVLSDFSILRCNSCSINTDNNSPIIGAEMPALTSTAQVFLSKDLVNGNIALNKLTYFRDVAFTDRNEFNSASGTFAGETVNFIKSAESIYDFSKYVYPATSTFGTNTVDTKVKQQVAILNGKTTKLINTVIVTKEKNIIEYNALTGKYEIRTVTPFDKDPTKVVLSSNSTRALCVQAADDSYIIQVGATRKKELASMLLNDESASALTKIGDFIISYGQGLKFFGNEYNKAWNEVATLVNEVTEAHLQISLESYICTNVETYYNTNYTTSRYLIFLTETMFNSNHTIFDSPNSSDVSTNIVDNDQPAPVSNLASVKLACGMGMWNGVTAIPSELVAGCASLSALLSSDKWSNGKTNVETFWNNSEKKRLILDWTTAVGSHIYDKAANADACEGAYFSGNIISIVASIIVVPEGVVDKLVSLAIKATARLTGATVKVVGKVLSYYTPSNIKILELGEDYLKIKWKGKDLEIQDATIIDDVSTSLDNNSNTITFDDNGIATTDAGLAAKLDELAQGMLAKYAKIRRYLADGKVKSYLNNQELLDFENLLKTASDDVLHVIDEFDNVDEFTEMVRGYKGNPAGFINAIKNVETFNGTHGWLNFWKLTPRMESSLNTIALLKAGNKLENIGNATDIQLASIHSYTANGDFINVPYRYQSTWFGEYNTRAVKHINEGLDELRKVPERIIINEEVFSGKTFSKLEFESKFVGKKNSVHSYNGYMSTSKLESVAEGFIIETKKWASSGDKIAVIQRVISKNGVYIDDISDWGKNLGKSNHSTSDTRIQVQEEVLLNSRKLKQVSEPIPLIENGEHKTIDGMKIYYVDFLEIL